MSKIVLVTLLAISLTGLAAVAAPAASAFECGPSRDPTVAYVQQQCDQALATVDHIPGSLP